MSFKGVNKKELFKVYHEDHLPQAGKCITLSSMHPYLSALFGGVLIGLAGLIYLLGNGRILGVSGIVGGCFVKATRKEAWRYAFFWGLIAGGMVMKYVEPSSLRLSLSFSPYLLIAAGLLVGYGVRMSGGCTSGHGVCGISRFSTRSVVATVIFILAGMATVYLFRHLLAGAR